MLQFPITSDRKRNPRMPENRFTGTRKKLILIQQWSLRLEKPISLLMVKPMCPLSDTLPHSPTSQPSTHLSFTFDTRGLSFSRLLASSARVRLNLVLGVRPFLLKQQTIWKNTHWTWLFINSLSGRRDYSHWFQEEFPQPQNGCWTQNQELK